MVYLIALMCGDGCSSLAVRPGIPREMIEVLNEASDEAVSRFVLNVGRLMALYHKLLVCGCVAFVCARLCIWNRLV